MAIIDLALGVINNKCDLIQKSADEIKNLPGDRPVREMLEDGHIAQIEIEVERIKRWILAIKENQVKLEIAKAAGG